MLTLRDLTKLAGLCAATALLPSISTAQEQNAPSLPAPIAQLKSRKAEAKPIEVEGQEDEDPYRLVAAGLKDRGISSGRIGIEERTTFVFSDGIAKSAPQASITSATAVTAGCRMIKTQHELDLMRLANQVTLEAYEAV